jgi:hypothetical protein
MTKTGEPQRPHEGDVSGDILAREANNRHMIFQWTSIPCGTSRIAGLSGFLTFNQWPDRLD